MHQYQYTSRRGPFLSIGGHGRWRLKILAIASIYWGSPLEFIGGVVLMLNVNKLELS